MFKNKKILRFTICLFIVGVMMVVWAYSRLRGGIKVFPQKDITGAEVVFYLQKDKRWKEETLGASTFTMSSSGCLVTFISAVMEMEGARGEKELMLNPKEMNQYFTQMQIYDSQGNIQWGKLDELESYQVDVYNEVSSQLIQDCLEQGKYPIARVRMKGYGNFHYVVIVEARDEMYYCMDPLNEENRVVPLSEFNNRIYALRCVYPQV